MFTWFYVLPFFFSFESVSLLKKALFCDVNCWYILFYGKSIKLASLAVLGEPSALEVL